MATIKSQRQTLNDTIETTERKLEEANQDILSIENRYQDIKAEQSRLDVLINHAIDHLSEQYHLTYERASELYTLEEDIDSLRKSKINQNVYRRIRPRKFKCN